MATKVSKFQHRSSFNLLTIVLLSNRQKEAIAALSYYESLGIFVILPAPNQQFYQSVSSLLADDSQVVILRPKSTEDNIYQRLSSCEPWIKSPYFVMASDDDMLLKEGLLSALQYLESNTKYASYYGLTATALFKAPFMPIIDPCYRLGQPLQHARPDPASIFLQYRSYPMIYGVSKTQVFSSFLRLFSSSEGHWAGIWEFNYSIAVSIHGRSFYDGNKPFLLRLVHRSSRSSLVDYPEAPELHESPREYLNKYVDTNVIFRLMSSSADEVCIDSFLRAVYIDILSDANLRSLPSIGPNIKFPLFRLLSRSVIKNIKQLISRPGYIFCFAAFFLAAIKYYFARTRSGISLLL